MKPLLLLLVAVASAQDSKVYFTNDVANGLYWRSMTSGEKLAFLIGFEGGIGSTVVPGGRISCTPDIEWANVTRGQTMTEVDTFYNSATNLPFPIFNAVIYVLWKQKGASTADLEAYRSLVQRTLN